MSHQDDTFFTSIGCMDGRVQEIVSKYGQQKFAVKYPDTITEAGLDGLLAKTQDSQLLESIKSKILISVEKHGSQGIIVHGHEDCAGNPVDKNKHLEDIKQSVLKVKEILLGHNIPVVGIYITLYPTPQIEET